MSTMIGDRLTRQDAVRRGKGEITGYQDAGISSAEMLPMYLTGTADAVNDSLSISRSTANKFDFKDDDRSEDTLRHILLGGLAEVGEEDSIFGAKNFLGTGIGSKVASSLIDIREGSKENRSAESDIDLNNNKFGRALRKMYPNREEFIQKAIDISRTMYAGDKPESIDELSPMLSYGATPVPQRAEGGIMMAQQGKMPLPMEEATSAPQGGGPKAANPAAQPEGLGAPTGAPAPAGSSDPRDEAIKEVAQKMQNRSAPAPIPAEVPQMAGLGAPMQEVPMMAKGGMADDSGMSVMIGLGAPSADYEKAAEGNPPPGATEEEVADDQLVLLSEGELVVPANVVRYHGLGTYEGMRRDALMGLQDMETNGQIEYVSGGDKKADKVDDDGGIIKANQGTFIQPPGTYTQNPVVPQAASSQYVQVPGNQGINPALINNITGLAKPVLNTLSPLNITGTPKPVNPNQPVTTASSVFAPNVGSYAGDGTDDDADDSTDDSTDDGTGTGETEEERRRRLAAQNEQSQDNNYDPTTAATTRFGGTVENGRIRGGKTYNIGYESSTAKPGTGMLGALMNIGNLDQVRITDPETGKSVAMSRDTYNKMTEDRTNSKNISFISDLIERQDGINYNRDRASKIAPFQTGLAVAGESILGLGNAPGLSLAEQNEYARSLANSLGIEYNGQSMAEIMASPEYNAPKEGGKSDVFREDAQGNLVRDTSYDTPTDRNYANEAAYGAGQFSGAPAQPSAVDSFTGPYTQPTLGLAAPTTEAGRLAQSITPAGNTSAVAMSMPNQMGIGDPATEAGRLAQFVAPTRDTVAAIPNEAARLASFAAPTRNTSAVAQMSSLGFDDGDEVGDYDRGSSTRQAPTREAQRAGERRGERAAYQASLFEDDYFDETPDNQGADMDDDAPEASFDMSSKEGRKAAADYEAQEQTGDSRSSAVTDKDGNPITNTRPDGTKGIVTNTPPKEDSGSSNDKSIVCTEMYRQTQLDDWAKTMKIWHIYQKKYLTPLHEIGYHWLFKPYVQGMRTSSILTNLGAFFAQKRTEHLKYVLTKGKSKDSLIGNIWCKIIHPIVYMVGKIVYKK